LNLLSNYIGSTKLEELMKSDKTTLKKKILWGQIILVILIVMITLGSVTTAFAEEETTTAAMSPEKANVTMFGLVAAALAFGFGAIGAGIAIANIGAAAMGAIGERPEIAGQALLFVALADGLAIFGFITALMILGKV
jgi:V/A-type H+/Na+-transporting ATPase subunit K